MFAREHHSDACGFSRYLVTHTHTLRVKYWYHFVYNISRTCERITIERASRGFTLICGVEDRWLGNGFFKHSFERVLFQQVAGVLSETE